MKNLDLYARVEHLIGFYEAYEELYDIYETFLGAYPVGTLLDVGCGNGRFLKRFKQIDARGVDLSAVMVERARENGVEAQVANICEMKERFGTLSAIADVLNYMDKEALETFLACVSERLEDKGIFMCDINTLYGFKEVAEGQFFIDNDKEFLAVEGVFEEDMLTTDITYFSKEEQCYHKESQTIYQHYHTQKNVEAYAKKVGLNLLISHETILFGEEADKIVLVFERVFR